jgi:hypothetical protein
MATDRSPQQLQPHQAHERKRIEKEKIAITTRHRILAGILERVAVPMKKADRLTLRSTCSAVCRTTGFQS